MKKNFLLSLLLMPFLAMAQSSVVPSGVYTWKDPVQPVQKNLLSATLFEGEVHDMDWLQMTANILRTGAQKTAMQVPANEEHLLIVKSGSITLAIQDSTWTLGAGSIGLLLPGEKFTLLNAEKMPSGFYTMKYRSKSPMDEGRGKRSGGSLVKDWKRIAFKPHDKGGIRNYFERPTAMCKRLEMHVSTLNPGLKSHDPHTHRAEEIVLVIDNKTEMQIGDKMYKGGPGSIYYLASNDLHAIQNVGSAPCTYFAFQFE